MIWQLLADIAITCLEVWFVIFLLQNEKTYKKHTQWILFFALVIVIAIMTWLNLNVSFRWLTIALLIVVIGHFIYDCNFSKMVLYAVLAILGLLIPEGIVIGTWNIFNPPIVSQNIYYDNFVLSTFLIAKSLNFLLIMILKKFMRNKEDRKFAEITPILCVGIPFFLVFECWNLMMSANPNITQNALYLVCCVAIFPAFIFTLLFLEKYLTMQKKAQQEEIALQEMKIKYGYYIRRQADEEKIRSIYHDLKNHLLLLKDETVAKQLASKIESYESYINTGNEFLDIVISEKIQMARESDIRTECDIDFRQGDFVDPLDISTIFGNLMDNAIEATMNIDDSNKYIFVDVQVKERLLIIVIKNSMIGTYNPDSQTSKTNSSFHGYGLVNVRKSIKKYNGEYSINSHANEFMISVVLPIPSDL